MEDQNQPNQPPIIPDKHLHPRVWIPVLVVLCLVVGYLLIANYNAQWPFQNSTSIPKPYSISFRVIDSITKQPIDDAEVKIDLISGCFTSFGDECPKPVTEDYHTNEQGRVDIRHEYLSMDYEISVEKSGYESFIGWLYELKDNEGVKEIPLVPSDSNWQTYRNEEYGFEVKYPQDWEAVGNSIRTKEFTTEESSGFGVQGSDDVDRVYEVYNQNIDFHSFLGLQSYKVFSYSELKEKVDDEMNCVQEHGNGSEILRMQNISWIFCRELPEGFTNLYYYIINERSGAVLTAHTRSNESILSPEDLKKSTEQILSTFKFIN